FIDHQRLSSDAYLKFIEDDFLGGARLNPKTDGRRDPRTVVRESSAKLGNLVNDFNFTQTPRRTLILPPCPATTLIARPVPGCFDHIALHTDRWGNSLARQISRARPRAAAGPCVVVHSRRTSLVDTNVCAG